MDEERSFRAKINQHTLITNIINDKRVKCEKLTAKLEKHEKEKAALISTQASLLNEFNEVRSMSTAYKQVQEYLHQVERTTASQTSGTNKQAVLTQPVAHIEPETVVAMLVEAALKAEQLENVKGVLEDLYAEANAKIIEITSELEELKVKERQMELLSTEWCKEDQDSLQHRHIKQGLKTEEIQMLKRNIDDLTERLKAYSEEVNIESQQRRQFSWAFSISSDSDSNGADSTTDDPVKLREKIRELKERIAFLLNHNDKWNTICESLKEEIEEAKRQLEETCRASSADHEIQQDGKSDSSLADWTSRIRLNVQILESRIVSLEKSLETKDYRDVHIERMQMADSDSRLAMQFQMEEIQQTNLALDREKSNTKSLKLQLDALHKQLDAAFKNREEVMLSNRRLQEKLQKVSGDKTLLEKHLSGSPTSLSGAEALHGSTHYSQKIPLSEKSTTNLRRRLEEDGK